MPLNSPTIRTFAPKPIAKQNVILEIILLLVIISLFSWFIIKPKAQTLKTKQSTLTKLETQRAELDKNKEILDNLVANLKASPGDAQALDEVLPLEIRATKAAVAVDNLAKGSGLVIANIALDPIAGSPVVAGNTDVLANPYKVERELVTLGLNATVSGTLEQFVGFLGALENTTRIIDVDGVEIVGQNGAQLSYKVKLKTYSYSP